MQPGLALEALEEVARNLKKLNVRVGGSKAPHEPRRVPRRPSGELRLLQKQHIPHPELGEVVQRAAADASAP